MKKHIVKIVSVFLAIALMCAPAMLSVTAITWDNVEETTYASHYSTSYYTYGKFYKNLTQVPITGDGARDVVAVAASQMGYLEGDSSAGYTGETNGSTNYTEYGCYLGLTGGSSHAWCAAFCSWCMYAAKATDEDGYYYRAESGYYWATTYVPYWSNMLYDNGRYRFSDYYRSSYDSSQASYAPQPGDLIFFTAGYEPLDEGHIGLVAFSDGTYVYTLEGNTSSQDGVESEGGGAFFKKYSLSSSSIAGYGILPYETVSDLPEIDYAGNNPTPGLYVTTSGAVGVYLSKNDSYASWTLPMSSIFEVSKIETADDGYTMLYSKCEIDGEIINGWIPLGNTSNGLTRTFQIYAAPDKAGLESDVYEITDENTVKGVTVDTTVASFASSVTTEGTLKFYKGTTLLSETSKLATGVTVDVLDENNEVVKTYTVVVKGDVTCDGNVNGLDYLTVKRHVLGTVPLDGVRFDAASLVYNNKVTAYDYIMIKRHVMGTYSLK